MTTTSLKFLASGGYGAVYKYDSKKGLGVVARKVFNINMEQASKHERNVLTRVGRHDNIVAYKGSGVIPAGFCNELIEGAPFIDFDFLDGPSLWELSYKEEIAHDWLTTLPRVCDIIRGLLAAVNHVHTQDFLHLDLKPGNVMVVKAKARDGFRLKPILIDFGISHHTSDTQQLQDHRGTDGYQPPEWWAGAVPTQAFDVWALGVVFYELLYGQRAVPVNEQLKRMKNRANGMVDSNNNNIYLANRSNEKTDTAERKERLVWQKKYNSAMEKASTEIQPIPRRTGRFPFIVPNDIHALVLHMLGQEKERPTIKEVQASPMFRSFQEGEYEQQRYAKQRALQKVDELQVEKKQVEKQLGRLQEEVNHLRQYNAELEAAPKPPKVKKVDIAVGNEGEDELSAAIRKCANLEQIVRDNDKTIADCVAQIEQEEDKLEMERNEKAKQEQDFAKLKVALENSIQQELSLIHI
jgi:serine/threonine protein kinase